jgi:hypothetical protein
MIITIFSLIMPGDNETTFLGIAIPVGVLLVSGSLFRRRLFANGRSWSTSFSEFIAMGIVNIGIAIAFVVVFASSDSKLEGGSVLFFLLLLTLITTLFDRFTLVAAERSASTTRAADASSVDGNDE